MVGWTSAGAKVLALPPLGSVVLVIRMLSLDQRRGQNKVLLLLPWFWFWF